jgi:hypothetical protein
MLDFDNSSTMSVFMQSVEDELWLTKHIELWLAKPFNNFFVLIKLSQSLLSK